MPKLPAIPKRSVQELSQMRLHRRMLERFMPAWWGWVGIALVPVLLAALAQWLIEAKDHADESALDHVTASYEYYVLGLMALTVALILWHYLHGRRDLFGRRGDRGG